jgi:hypothetical protein
MGRVKGRMRGYFEILLLTFKLQRRVYVFMDTKGKNDFIHIMTAGRDFDSVPPCVLLWRGTHYDCMKMKKDEDLELRAKDV